MKMIKNEEDLPAMKDAAAVADRLLGHVMTFVNKWLETEADGEVVMDETDEEAVVVSGGKKNGHGHVSLNFYFKKRSG